MTSVKQHNSKVLADLPAAEELLSILNKLQNPPVVTVNEERVSLQYGFQGKGPRLDIFPEYGDEFRLTTYWNRGFEIVSLEDVFPRKELESVIKVLSITYI